MSRHPNQVSVYGKIGSRKSRIPTKVNEEKATVRQADLDALAAMQATRPAKPPGKR